MKLNMLIYKFKVRFTNKTAREDLQELLALFKGWNNTTAAVNVVLNSVKSAGCNTCTLLFY